MEEQTVQIRPVEEKDPRITLPLEILRHISLFEGLSNEQLSCDVVGEIKEYRKGEIMWQEGDPARLFVVVLEGTLQIYRIVRGQRLLINRFTPGMTGGEVPLLAGTPHPGNAVALTDVKLFVIYEDEFWAMMGTCPIVRKRILANMAERTKEINTLTNQREKLISLGTMSAGLAHELNNPASAAKRAAQNLMETLTAFDSHSAQMLKDVVFKEKNLPGDPFLPFYEKMQLDGVKLNTLEKNDREDELLDWLEDQGVEDAWDLASTFVSVGYTREMLADFAEQLLPEHVINFLRWMPKDIEMRLLAQELKQSTERISALIQAIKAYTYMDQESQYQSIDLHEGLTNTLIILNHKLKVKEIEVVKDFGTDIPKIHAFGSELNQVWTNLLDNAIDAVPQKGKIIIRTFLDPTDENMVSIEMEDNGVGIPKEIQDRIFEPFFTTKGVGKGTGIGLEISQRIIVNQHKGTMKVKSEPGKTIFKVCLPINLALCN
ncbi:MAG: ATP-binding protein [Bacteroidota bacterium]|nr:ATP-binding protein [Bacteroidota bacterium]